MAKKNKSEFKVEINFAAIAAILFMVCATILIALSITSNAKVEGTCTVDQLSFTVNESNQINNLTLDQGKIKCEFKGEAPLFLLLRS